VLGIYETIEIAIYGYVYAPNMTESLHLAGHKNLLSSAMFLTMPFSIYGVYSLKHKWKWLSIIGLITACLIIAALQSRSVILALICSAIIYGIMIWLHQRRKEIQQVVVGIVLLLSVLVIGAIFKLKVIDQKEHAATESSASLVERYKLWGINPFK